MVHPYTTRTMCVGLYVSYMDTPGRGRHHGRPDRAGVRCGADVHLAVAGRCRVDPRLDPTPGLAAPADHCALYLASTHLLFGTILWYVRMFMYILIRPYLRRLRGGRVERQVVVVQRRKRRIGWMQVD